MSWEPITDEMFSIFMDKRLYKTITEEVVEYTRRWESTISQVFQKIEDNTYWEVVWNRGNTEYQDAELDAQARQVKPVQVTVTKYIEV